jgi:hypothetical protein
VEQWPAPFEDRSLGVIMLTKILELLVGVLAILAVIVLCLRLFDPPEVAHSEALSRPPPASARPVPQVAAEPCRIEHTDATARPFAEKFCTMTGGMFQRVSVTYDANNIVAILQFSNTGQTTWDQGQLALLNVTRQIVDKMVTTTDTNVAVSLHEATTTLLVGGCFRRRGEVESTCNGQ